MAGNQKKAEEEGRVIVFADESGFRLLPAAVRTWAPKGRTPVLKAKSGRDRISAVGATTADGRTFARTILGTFDSNQAVRFLDYLLGRVAGKLLVIWDGASPHRSARMRAWLAARPDDRIRLERLPPYAPELNPQEGIWKHLKMVELACVVSKTTAGPRSNFRRAMERLRKKRNTILGCIRQTGLV